MGASFSTGWALSGRWGSRGDWEFSTREHEVIQERQLLLPAWQALGLHDSWRTGDLKAKGAPTTLGGAGDSNSHTLDNLNDQIHLRGGNDSLTTALSFESRLTRRPVRAQNHVQKGARCMERISAAHAVALAPSPAQLIL